MEGSVGNRLFTEVAELTELPSHLISTELVSILEKVGADPNELSINQLREAMAAYLMEVIGPELGVDPESDSSSS